MRKITLLLVAALVCGGSLAQAALPTIPGFGSKERASATRNADGGSAFKTPPVLTKMTAGTKRLVTNTKNLLTPKTKKKSSGGLKLGVTSVKRREQQEPPQQSFWGRLFNPQEPEPPRTMAEWMSLKQPHP